MTNYVVYNNQTGIIEAWMEEEPTTLESDRSFIETQLTMARGKYYRVDVVSKTVIEVIYSTTALDWSRVRNTRNALIAQTDYVMTPDYPIDAELMAAVRSYREALRNITETYSNPDSVIWPKNPLDK